MSCLAGGTWLTVVVFGLTKALHASVMTEQAKTCAGEGTPLRLHFDAEEVVVVDGAAGVVEILGVVEGAAGVVLGALGVVEGAAGVVLGALGVVEGAAGVVLMALVVESCLFRCLFLKAFVQGAFTVTDVDTAVPVCVAVTVESVIGTKDEQKAEAFIAIKMLLQTSTLPVFAVRPRIARFLTGTGPSTSKSNTSRCTRWASGAARRSLWPSRCRRETTAVAWRIHSSNGRRRVIVLNSRVVRSPRSRTRESGKYSP